MVALGRLRTALLGVTLVLGRDQATHAAAPPWPHLDVYGDSLPDGAVARCGTLRLRHRGAINSVALSRDGKTLASAGEDGTIRIWCPTTGRQILAFGANGDHAVRTIAFSPDNHTLAACDQEGQLGLWDAATGKQLRLLPGRHEEVEALVFADDGKTLAGVSNGSAWLRDVSSGKELRRLRVPNVSPGLAAAFSPDLRVVACGTYAGNVFALDLVTGKKLYEMHPHKGWTGAVAFSPDGRFLVSGGKDDPLQKDPAGRPRTPEKNHVYLWDATTGKEIRRFGPHANPIHSLSTSPDGKRLLVCDYGGGARLLEVATGKELGRYGEIPGRSLHLAFSREGKTLFGHDGRVRLWDSVTGEERPGIAGHSGEVQTLVFTPDGRTLISGSQDYTIRFWSPTTGRQIRPPLYQPDNVLALALTPDAKQLFTGSSDRSIRLWDLQRSRVVRRWLASKESCVNALALSPDCKIIASGSWDGRMSTWDVATGRSLATTEILDGFVRAVAFSPDGEMVVSGSRSLVAWAPATGRCIRTLVERPPQSPSGRVETGHEPTCRSLAISSSGLTLVVARGPEGVWTVDLARGSKARCFAAEPNQHANVVALSPDGRLLACGMANGKVLLYETATSQRRCQFSGHRATVEALAFSPDGKLLASAGDSPLVWDLLPSPSAGSLPSAALLQLCIRDLASDDAETAHRAIRALVRYPALAVAALSKSVQAIPLVSDKRVARLVANLDGDDFAARQDAEGLLRGLDTHAEPLLRQALTDKPSLEIRLRVKRLLDRLEAHPATSPDARRAWRALEVLEHVGSPEATGLLREMARGAPGARLTREAKAACDRLSKHPKTDPVNTP